MTPDSDEIRRARGPVRAHEHPPAEVAELRASRERLVRAADGERRRLERELHDGLQQRLVALAVELQLAETPASAGTAPTLLADLRREVEEALDDARRLAQRIHAPLEFGGLAVALRAAATSAGTPARVEVTGASRYPDEVARSIFLCWLEALDAAADVEPAIEVREEDGSLAFELSAGDGALSGLEGLRDRVEALGGRLVLETGPPGGVHASGSLPF